VDLSKYVRARCSAVCWKRAVGWKRGALNPDGSVQHPDQRCYEAQLCAGLIAMMDERHNTDIRAEIKRHAERCLERAKEIRLFHPLDQRLFGDGLEKLRRKRLESESYARLKEAEACAAEILQLEEQLTIDLSSWNRPPEADVTKEQIQRWLLIGYE